MTTHTPLRCANSVMSGTPATGFTGQRVVLLDTGNFPSFSSFLNETWVFTGTDWTNLSTTLIDASGPLPGRINGVMSSDGYGVMLFGGQTASSTAGVLEDTWLWNGTTWAVQTPTTVPFGRYGAAATYLAGTGVVMFGGENLLFKTLETWVWNGNTKAWSLVTVANGSSPAARCGHVMAASGSLVLLFGGEGTNSQFNDTWTFNGTTWTKLTPATSPSVRSDACMSYDTVNNIWVLFGGKNEYNYLDETWTFNGTTWTQVTVANGTGPEGYIGAQMAFDASSGKTIMFGGISATNNYSENDTWSFDGSALTWTKL